MAMKGYPHSAKLQDWSLTIRLFSVIPRTLVEGEGLNSLQRYSCCILQPQLTRWSWIAKHLWITMVIPFQSYRKLIKERRKKSHIHFILQIKIPRSLWKCPKVGNKKKKKKKKKKKNEIRWIKKYNFKDKNGLKWWALLELMYDWIKRFCSNIV